MARGYFVIPGHKLLQNRCLVMDKACGGRDFLSLEEARMGVLFVEGKSVWKKAISTCLCLSQSKR